jgi:hypothetical protein
MTSPPPQRESMESFERIELAPPSPSPPPSSEALVDLYKSWRLLWLRPRADEEGKGDEATRRIMRAIASGTGAGEEWSVENSCGAADGALDAETVIGSLAQDDRGDGHQSRRRRKNGTASDAVGTNNASIALPPLPPRFYCSTVLNGEAAARALAEAPLSEPPFLTRADGAQHGAPMWLFVGSNSSSTTEEPPSNNKKAKKKSKKSSTTAAAAADAADDDEYVAGRSEHTDHVACSGTWHYQVSGPKVWYLRPLDGADAWRGNAAAAAADDEEEEEEEEEEEGVCDAPEVGCRSGGAGGASVVEDVIDDDDEGGWVGRRRRLRLEVGLYKLNPVDP